MNNFLSLLFFPGFVIIGGTDVLNGTKFNYKGKTPKGGDIQYMFGPQKGVTCTKTQKGVTTKNQKGVT